MEFNYKGIRVIYNEDFDNEEAISDFLDELFEFYYEDLRNVKVIDFSNGDSDYFLIDGQPYQYSGGRLYLFDVENDEITESFKGQEYFEYRDLCKKLGLETYDQILAFVKEHNCKNDQELLNTLRDTVKSKNECVDDVRFMSETVNEDSNKSILDKLKEEIANFFKNKHKQVEVGYNLIDGRYLRLQKRHGRGWISREGENLSAELNIYLEKKGFNVSVIYNNAFQDFRMYVDCSKLNETLKEDLFNPEEVEEPEKEEVSKENNKEPETFEEKMDFLAADEQEAIDGYEKIIAAIDDEHVKEQLNKIMIEEKAHKEYLEKVKEDQSIDYTEPLEDEEDKDTDEKESKEEIDENLKLREGKEITDFSWSEICNKMQQDPLIALNGGNKYEYVGKVKDLQGNEKMAVIGVFSSLKDLYNDYPKAKKLSVYIPNNKA